MKSNPQISKAPKDREAIEFERRLARGLYLPSVDLEAGIGRRRFANPTSGGLNSDHNYFSPGDVGPTVTQTVYDVDSRRAELVKQAFRVVERCESLALDVTQDYLEYILQNQIVAAAQQNVAFQNQMLGDINESINSGGLTDADRLQGHERQDAAAARLREALEELEAAKIRFLQAVGGPITNAQTPPSVNKSLPKTLNDAVFIAAKNSRASTPPMWISMQEMPACAVRAPTTCRRSVSKARRRRQ
jgi:adhesin transport system outer membrane protein